MEVEITYPLYTGMNRLCYYIKPETTRGLLPHKKLIQKPTRVQSVMTTFKRHRMNISLLWVSLFCSCLALDKLFIFQGCLYCKYKDVKADLRW